MGARLTAAPRGRPTRAAGPAHVAGPAPAGDRPVGRMARSSRATSPASRRVTTASATAPTTATPSGTSQRVLTPVPPLAGEPAGRRPRGRRLLGRRQSRRRQS